MNELRSVFDGDCGFLREVEGLEGTRERRQQAEAEAEA